MNLLLRDVILRQGSFQLRVDAQAVGDVLGILGKSGAGKTTLLEIIAGLRQPSTGMISIDDTVLLDRKAHLYLPPETRGVGYVPQDLALFPHLSVRRNINYGRTKAPSSQGSPSLSFEHVIHLLEIEPLLDRSVTQLSGGQKQRVAFARALLAHPRLLLLDEPLASLDADLKLKIIPYLQRIRDECRIPMIYVSHSPEELVALCNQILLLDAGTCLGLHRPEEIFEQSTTVALKPGLLP